VQSSLTAVCELYRHFQAPAVIMPPAALGQRRGLIITFSFPDRLCESTNPAKSPSADVGFPCAGSLELRASFEAELPRREPTSRWVISQDSWIRRVDPERKVINGGRVFGPAPPAA